jgi:hypothetical protein
MMAEKDEQYNKLKEYQGKRYSGMKIGGTHKWYYDKGEWRERKITPEEWDIFYETRKSRAGNAPKGSGAPVGTAYNWLIVAHQRVDKLDANTYMTHLDGKKFKVAHLRAKKGKWNIAEKTQREKVIAFLEKVIADIKDTDNDDVPFSVDEEKKRIYGLKHMTKKELYDIAADRDIDDRSKMKRDELLNAIIEDKKEHEQSENGEAAMDGFSQMTREELYDIAAELEVSGRSKMKKKELMQAIKADKESGNNT